jgi:hypothetical protein
MARKEEPANHNSRTHRRGVDQKMYLEGMTLNHIILIHALMGEVRADAATLAYPDVEHPTGRLYDDVVEIRGELAALAQLYNQRDPQHALEQALLAADEMKGAIDNVLEVYKSVPSLSLLWPLNILRYDSRKKSAYKDVRDKASTLSSMN